MRQASMTAAEYMSKACIKIDEQFGKGYAHDHPELVIAFMRTCTIDFATAMIVSALEKE